MNHHEVGANGLPWRLGRHQSHNIYDVDDNCVGHTHNPVDAELIVRAVNRYASEEGSQPEDNLQQHQGTDEERSSSETGSSDRPAHSETEETTSPRPAMTSPWYTDET